MSSGASVVSSGAIVSSGVDVVSSGIAVTSSGPSVVSPCVGILSSGATVVSSGASVVPSGVVTVSSDGVVRSTDAVVVSSGVQELSLGVPVWSSGVVPVAVSSDASVESNRVSRASSSLPTWSFGTSSSPTVSTLPLSMPSVTSTATSCLPDPAARSLPGNTYACGHQGFSTPQFNQYEHSQPHLSNYINPTYQGLPTPIVQPSLRDNSLEEFVSTQKRQTELSQLTVSQQARSLLPSHKPPTFGGDPVKYPAFMTAFESKVSDPIEKLYFLERYTSGKAKELISGCIQSKSNYSFVEAKSLLKKHYGDPFKIANAHTTKL